MKALQTLQKILALIVLVSFGPVKASTAATTGCASGWIAYKDEKCFHVPNETPVDFEAAQRIAANEHGDTTLVSIHDAAEQAFLANYLFKTRHYSNAFWLGAQFNSQSHSYQWLDKSTWAYSNWEKAPRNYTCLQMEADSDLQGKWIDEPCTKKNLVVVQKAQEWTISRLQKTLLEMRKELTDLKVENDHLKHNQVPIGFTYVQLPKDKAPSEIWPLMTWTDVSNQYSGTFFRVVGDGSAAFGTIQHENVPQIDKITYVNSCGDSLSTTLKANAWSDPVVTGIFGVGDWHNCHQYRMSGGEVRPKNMAMKVWRRTA